MDFGMRSVWLRKARQAKCVAADHYVHSHEAEGREEFGAGYRIQGPFWSKYFFWSSVTFLRVHRLPKMYHQLRNKIWNPQVGEEYFALVTAALEIHWQAPTEQGVQWKQSPKPSAEVTFSGVYVEHKYLHFLYPLSAVYTYTCP